MFEYKGIPMVNIPVPAEKVDLFHFDPFNPDGHCRCGHDGNHGCRKCCHKHEKQRERSVPMILHRLETTVNKMLS